MNQVKAGALLSYVNIFVFNLANLLFTPFLLRCLGQSGYGLYSLIGAFAGYVAVLDFGLGNAIVRYVARFRAERDPVRESEFFSLSLVMYGLLALLSLGVGGVMYANIGRIFSSTMTASEMADARLMFVLMIVNLALSFPLSAFTSIVTAYEHFVFLRLTTLGRVLLRISLLVPLLLFGYRAVAIVVLDTALNIAIGLLTLLYARYRIGVRLRRCRFEKPFVIEVLRYSFFVFINVVVDQLYWRVGQVVLGVMSGTVAVAVFALANTVVQYFIQFSTAISSVFLPKITMMVFEHRDEEIAALFARTGRMQLVILAYVLGGFALVGGDFIRLWAGDEYGGAWQVAMVIMVPLTVPLIQNLGLQILQARNMHAFRSLMYLAIAAVNVVLTVWLVRRLGVLGAALGTTLSLVLGNIVVINAYYHHVAGIDIPRFIRQVASGIVPAFVLSLLLGGVALRFVPGTSWGAFALRAAVYSAIYAALMWFHGTNDYEKGVLRGLARRVAPSVAAG